MSLFSSAWFTFALHFWKWIKIFLQHLAVTISANIWHYQKLALTKLVLTKSRNTPLSLFTTKNMRWRNAKYLQTWCFCFYHGVLTKMLFYKMLPSMNSKRSNTQFNMLPLSLVHFLSLVYRIVHPRVFFWLDVPSFWLFLKVFNDRRGKKIWFVII